MLSASPYLTMMNLRIMLTRSGRPCSSERSSSSSFMVVNKVLVYEKKSHACAGIGSSVVRTAAAAAAVGPSMLSGERLERDVVSSDDCVDTSPFSVGTVLLPSADNGDSTIGSSFVSGIIAASEEEGTGS